MSLCPLKSCKNSCHCMRDYGLLLILLVISGIIWIFKLNTPVFLMLNKLHVLLPVHVWHTICLIAAPRHFILAIALILIAILFKRKYLPRVVITLVAFYVIFFALKVLVGEARPFVEITQHSFYFLPSVGHKAHDAYHSFPSGHVGLSTLFVFALIRLYHIRSQIVKVILVLFPVLVAVARIATGWHWPLDVLISGVLGYLIVVVCFYRYK